jgi:hypothetical protein
VLKEYNGTVPPCGVFCGGCPTYLKEKKSCPGAGISQRCESRSCRYFFCCTEKGVAFCHQCDRYPCRRFKVFARNWKKYGQDFLENQEMLKELGAAGFLQYWNSKANKAKTTQQNQG